MKVAALSVYQPYASLFAIGRKRWDTRGAPLHYRGALVLHAARAHAPDAMADLQTPAFQEALAGFRNPSEMFGRVAPDDLPYGVAVALVDMVDCVPTEKVPRSVLESEGLFGNFAAGRYAYRFENIRVPVGEIGIKGGQGLFTAEIELAAFRPL